MDATPIDAKEAVRQLLNGEASIEFTNEGVFFVNKDGVFPTSVETGWEERKTTDEKSWA